MENERPRLSKKQAEFLRDEFGMDISAGDTLDLDEEKEDEIIMDLQMIECDEAEKQYLISERGRIAISILDEQFG